jgi:uncharacterized tellurite resistance protein B-like protein
MGIVMLKRIRQLLDAATTPAAAAAPADDEHALRLATAVMLVEVMRADASFAGGEREVVRAALVEKFALSDEEAHELAELAETAARNATDYYSFTSRINERFEMAQKLRMVEHMWRVAYADGTLTAHENHVMWRLADLLHVPHGAYINAKMRAREAPAG